MKKIFTLLALFMTTVFAMAQTQFKGTFHSNPGAFQDYDDVVLTVTANSDNSTTFVFDRVVLGNDDLGKVTIANVWTETSGSTKNFSMGNIPFTTSGGNLSGIEKGNIQGYGQMDDESITLTFQYFEYGSQSLRSVKYTGTPYKGGDDKPHVVSTEKFTSTMTATSSLSENEDVTDKLEAQLSEWSDGTFGLKFGNFDADVIGTVKGLSFTGLQKAESDGLTNYTAEAAVPAFEEVPSVFGARDLTAEVTATLNEDGQLSAIVVLKDGNDPEFEARFVYTAKEPEVYEPYEVNGTLAGFTHTADGDFDNSASSVMTIQQTSEDDCKVSLTNVNIPGVSIALGTVTIENVALNIDDDTNVASFSKEGGVATTTAEHPLYTEVDLKSFSATATVEDKGETQELTSLSATLSIDNYDETVTYTFSATVTGVKTITAADGTVTRVYSLSGARLNSLQRGVNIVRTADGKTVKVLK